MPQGNLQEDKFILASDSRAIGIHQGGETWWQVSGAARTGS